MREVLRTSFGCLFIALALNVAFTHAQERVAPIPRLNDLPWLKVIFQDNKHRPVDVTIITTFEPQITRLQQEQWKISFIKPN